MHCDEKNLTIGSGGDGPALRIDAEMFKGTTSACETYNSPILIEGAKKHEDDEFKAQNIEIFVM